MIKHFLKYYSRAITKYRVHSPFVYSLLINVIEDKRYYYAFDPLKTLRARLLQQNQTVAVLDLGAGSRKNSGKTRKISEIAKTSVSPEWQCQMLFRLVDFFKPETVLELGSSLGVSSMYLHFGNQRAKMVSLEGSPEIAKQAKENFKLLNANIDLIEGNFSETLQLALNKLGKIDLAFIDGHHAEVPTLNYFEQILPYCNEDSVLIFDDIYWSDEMAAAWKKIKLNPAVTMSIDLFYFGIVFFKKEFKEKQHFTLIPYPYKFWQIGLFK
jgi:predicted O-methyltransferase YrrM